MEFSLYAVLLFVAPFLVAFAIWRAIANARTAQGAVAWAVFLAAAPWFALPAFAVFGRRKLRGYTRARRASEGVIRQMEAYGEAHPVAPEITAAARPFSEIGGMPVVAGNDLTLLIDGQATFEAIFAAIDGAESYVLVQFYTIVDDDLGGRLADRLVAAARRGVVVRMMYDGVGSYGLGSDYIATLTSAGVEVLDPSQVRGPTSRLEINFRNHRKTVIIDGHKGFIGGHNVSELYLGRDEKMGHWRDTHLMLEGPTVTQLQLVFAEDWHFYKGEALNDELNWRTPEVPGGQAAIIVPTGPADVLDTGSLLLFSAITAARDRVWIASPYFVPDRDILSALMASALAGRDVRILIPDAIDHHLPWLAAHSYFDEVRRAGVKIYRYTNGFTHQKVILTDDDFAAVGTTNLDNRSFRLNFETMAAAWDTGFAAEVDAMLKADFEHATLLEKDLADHPLWVRVGAPLSRLLAPIL